MSDIIIAMEWLKSGKKIRREGWNTGNFLTLTKSGRIINNYGETVEISFIDTMLATDWRTYERDDKKWVKDKLKRIKAILEED